MPPKGLREYAVKFQYTDLWRFRVGFARSTKRQTKSKIQNYNKLRIRDHFACLAFKAELCTDIQPRTLFRGPIFPRFFIRRELFSDFFLNIFFPHTMWDHGARLSHMVLCESDRVFSMRGIFSAYVGERRQSWTGVSLGPIVFFRKIWKEKSWIFYMKLKKWFR